MRYRNTPAGLQERAADEADYARRLLIYLQSRPREHHFDLWGVLRRDCILAQERSARLYQKARKACS